MTKDDTEAARNPPTTHASNEGIISGSDDNEGCHHSQKSQEESSSERNLPLHNNDSAPPSSVVGGCDVAASSGGEDDNSLEKNQACSTEFSKRQQDADLDNNDREVSETNCGEQKRTNTGSQAETTSRQKEEEEENDRLRREKRRLSSRTSSSNTTNDNLTPPPRREVNTNQNNNTSTGSMLFRVQDDNRLRQEKERLCNPNHYQNNDQDRNIYNNETLYNDNRDVSSSGDFADDNASTTSAKSMISEHYGHLSRTRPRSFSLDHVQQRQPQHEDTNSIASASEYSQVGASRYITGDSSSSQLATFAQTHIIPRLHTLHPRRSTSLQSSSFTRRRSSLEEAIENESMANAHILQSQPGAFAEAPSMTVPRRIQSRQSLNEQMARQSARNLNEQVTTTRQSIQQFEAAADQTSVMGGVPTANTHSEDGNETISTGGHTDATATPTLVVEYAEAFQVLEDNSNNPNASEQDPPTVDLEDVLRQKILDEAVAAHVVHKQTSNNQRRISLLCFLVSMVLISSMVGLTVGLIHKNDNATSDQKSNDNDDDLSMGDAESEPTVAPLPPATNLQDILDRGVLRCGVFEALSDPNIAIPSFELLCKAMAASIFGRDGADKYEIKITAAADSWFIALQSGDIDVLDHSITFTLGRDISETVTGQGYTFSYPLYYQGLVFAGVPEFVDCAERLDSFNGICRQLKMCVGKTSTKLPLVRELLTGTVVVPVNSPLEGIRYLNAGMCNVAASELIRVAASSMERIGLDESINFTTGTKIFSLDPGALVTSDGSTELSDVVNSVIKILYTAEDMNLTQANVATYEFGPDLDVSLKERIITIVSTVGNAADVFKAANVEGLLDRSGMNSLNRFDNSSATGLMIPYPLGQVDHSPPPTTTSETMDEIELRGRLRCGILKRPFFGEYDEVQNEYVGFDVEYCRALSAALFVGSTARTRFILLDNEADLFKALAIGWVDVVVGARVTLTNEFFEPTTRQSYSFSTPTYYDAQDGSIWAVATRRKDEFWSSFVFWVTMALIHAEEHNITSSNAVQMPAVNVFGDLYIQAFRDCISGVGNYGDIYDRTLQPHIPRAGRNQLNQAPFGPQQVGYPIQ